MFYVTVLNGEVQKDSQGRWKFYSISYARSNSAGVEGSTTERVTGESDARERFNIPWLKQ